MLFYSKLCKTSSLEWDLKHRIIEQFTSEGTSANHFIHLPAGSRCCYIRLFRDEYESNFEYLQGRKLHNLSRSGWLLLTHYASLHQMLADNALAFGKSQTYSFLFHTAFFTALFGCLYCLLPHLPLQDPLLRMSKLCKFICTISNGSWNKNILDLVLYILSKEENMPTF